MDNFSMGSRDLSPTETVVSVEAQRAQAHTAAEQKQKNLVQLVFLKKGLTCVPENHDRIPIMAV